MNTKRSLGALAVIAALLAGTADATAQTGNLKRQMLFSRLDANGDGRVNQAEIDAMRERIFDRLDRDGDGAISEREELQAADRVNRAAALLQITLAGRFETLDADGDGRVSKGEYAAGGGGLALLDTDGDGELVPDELARLCALTPKGCN